MSPVFAYMIPFWTRFNAIQSVVSAQETQIKLFEPEVQAMRTAIGDLAARVSDGFARSPGRAGVDPAAVVDSLEQFFNILDSTEPARGARDMAACHRNKFGDYGIGLVNELMQGATDLGLDEEQHALQMIIIPLALLVIRRGVQIHDLEPVVTALSVVADNTHHPRQLAELAEVMEEVINAAAPEAKQQRDPSNPQRPWRILNLNHAIVATRTHDPQIMQGAFEQLMYRLPDDAPGFFAEGMQQMDIFGYPDHVRELMQKYYELSNKPTLH